jgi:membrane associated rhomboid family serine protease
MMTDTILNNAPLKKEPMVNVPLMTFWCAILLAVIFGTLQIQKSADVLIPLLSFVPMDFSADPLNTSYTLLGYGLLHFGWPHIAINLAGLIAFGSGIERMLGKRFLSIILIGGCIVGALGHWALFPDSGIALGGASAGISALFGGILPLLMKRKDLIAANVIFLLTNVGLGQLGVAGEPGFSIAWQAHIFGFIFGEILVFFILRKSLFRNEEETPSPDAAVTDESSAQ